MKGKIFLGWCYLESGLRTVTVFCCYTLQGIGLFFGGFYLQDLVAYRQEILDEPGHGIALRSFALAITCGAWILANLLSFLIKRRNVNKGVPFVLGALGVIIAAAIIMPTIGTYLLSIDQFDYEIPKHSSSPSWEWLSFFGIALTLFSWLFRKKLRP